MSIKGNSKWFPRSAARRLCLTAAAAAYGQSPIDPADTANAVWLRTFESDLAQTESRSELECRVDTTEPALDYSLPYRAGFYATLPTTQFRPEGSSFTVGLRVSALNGGVYYLAQVAYVPPAPRIRDVVINFGGGFEPDEGSYKVDWLIRDERGRKCRKSWDVHLALAVVSLPKEREIFRSEAEPVVDHPDLARMIGKLEFTTVGFNQLKRPYCQINMLADLVDAAVRSQETPDAIVFIGPNAGENGKAPRQLPRAMPGRKPLFYYLPLT